jgi:hypothetical protein
VIEVEREKSKERNGGAYVCRRKRGRREKRGSSARYYSRHPFGIEINLKTKNDFFNF